jgi:MoaA/NifB/PqqE/SkfB family radical SAM enzyme
MSHADMSFDLFKEIVDSYYQPSHFLLQGTGEPLLHKDLAAMLVYLKERGHTASIITNGTIEISSEIIKNIDRIQFSIDEEKVSDKIVKTFEKSKENILKVIKTDQKKVSLTFVDYGQNMSFLYTFARKYKIKISSQPLQSKDSYQKKYKKEPNQKENPNFSCKFTDNELLDFYFVSGKKAPCCFMIYEDNALTRDEIVASFSNKEIPLCCAGCEFVYFENREARERGFVLDIKYKIKKLKGRLFG